MPSSQLRRRPCAAWLLAPSEFFPWSPAGRRRAFAWVFGGLSLLALLLWPVQGEAAASDGQVLKLVLPSLTPSAAAYSHYFPQLLRLALDKTKASDGPYRIEFFEGALSSSRQVLELKNQGLIDVIWDGSDK